MRFLITGGSGFIGTNIIDFLNNIGHDVLSIDLDEPECKRHQDLYLRCDIRDLNSLSNVVNNYNPDYIIHLAARTDLQGDSINDYDSNTTGVENVCIVSKSCGSLKKVFFASSMLVCEVGSIPTTVDDFSPTTLYGESKVIGEKIVRAYSQELPDFIIARPTSIWGPWFKEPYRNFFDIVIKERFFEFGPRMATKTYGFIDNICGQIVSLTITKEDLKNSLVYLGDDDPLDICKWASDIAYISNVRKPIKIPFYFIKSAAILGDCLKVFGFNFPMTSFRLKNMTTDNVFSCSIASSTNVYDTVSYDLANQKTVQWISNRACMRDKS